MKLHHGAVFTVGMRSRRSVQGEFHEIVVPETIDAGRKRTLQDRHVTLQLIDVFVSLKVDITASQEVR